ncbi:MAG: hypothetical protein AB1898_12465 [Acidobacteriota bacterium]
MSSWQKWSFHILNVLVSLTGVVYFWMKYLVVNDDPFSVINHPFQPAVLKAHILLAPLFVFVLGVIFASHISQKLENNTVSNRRSGLVALLSFPVMVLSGYALQILSTTAWVQAAVWLHVGSSVAFLASFGAHQVISWRLRRRAGLKEQSARVVRLAKLG